MYTTGMQVKEAYVALGIEKVFEEFKALVSSFTQKDNYIALRSEFKGYDRLDESYKALSLKMNEAKSQNETILDDLEHDLAEDTIYAFYFKCKNVEWEKLYDQATLLKKQFEQIKEEDKANIQADRSEFMRILCDEESIKRNTGVFQTYVDFFETGIDQISVIADRSEIEVTHIEIPDSRTGSGSPKPF
ncbi:MAG: hypothetical protein MJZ33_11285 [Paludibacteraceae bacterium]|nr:hypothetical protein [Paludibacteraceae bacterium]